MKRSILIAAILLAAVTSRGQDTMFARAFGGQADKYLLAWYQLDGNALDSGTTRANGIWAGTIAYTNGRMDTAASFNGASCITSAVPVPSSITVSMWVKGSVPGGGTFKRFLCLRTGNYWVQVVGSPVTNVLQFGVVTNGNGAAVTSGKISGATGDFSEYRHVAGVWNGVTTAFYMDGVLQTGNYSGGMGAGGDGILSIGARSDSIAATGHSGQIDDVRIYNRALSSNDVVRIYNGLNPVHD